MLAVLIVLIVMLWLDRRSLFQEGNPITMLPTLLRLETSQAEILSATPDHRLLIARMSPKHTAIDHYLARSGWKRNDQMGALLPYYRGEDHLSVHARIYLHGRYWA